jgi:putative nucleotidyltransferase with HDIG domain
LTWDASDCLRIGRLESLQIMLNEPSVSRRHAEIKMTDEGWALIDSGSSNGTFLNDVRIGRTPQRLRQDDIIRCGEVRIRVDRLVNPDQIANKPIDRPANIQTSRTYVRLKATVKQSWEEAIDVLARRGNQTVGQDQRFLTLLRAGHHLCQANSLDELLQSILNDTVTVLKAQRGSIVLVDEWSGHLQMRAATSAVKQVDRERMFSRTLIRRSLHQGQSLLCQDVQNDAEIRATGCITTGGMASIVCALLRTPRRPLGVLHLDRSPSQEPFSQDDLFLADAIAASVSTGIECSQLIEIQRQQAVHTVTALAQAVEMRDRYTGGHTQRVTSYAMLLAQELKLSQGDQHLLQIGTPLHDIGKIGINDDVLRKPGRLTPSEFEHMKSHTIKGAAIVETIPNFAGVLPIIRSHHEHWDGSGYPDGFSNDHISHLARVVTVADAFDAMTSERPYRTALPLSVAFDEIAAKAGTHFDPDCVAAFLRLRETIQSLMNQEQDQVESREELGQTCSRSELVRLMNKSALTRPMVTAGAT